MRHQTGDDIGVFLAVCEAGHFAAAADRLALSPSAVAKAISRLESRLKVKLFQRTTRRLHLTMEGQLYRDVCSAARLEIDRAEAQLHSLARRPMGQVRISLPPAFGALAVAPALYELCRQYPGLELDISTSTDTIDLPGKGTDLAIRIGALPDIAGLAARQLGMQHVVLCASRSYMEGRQPPCSLDDLADHELIAEGRNGRIMPWQFQQPDEKIIRWAPKARLLLEGSLLVLSAIQAGHGLGLLPYWLAKDDLQAGRLISLLEDRISGHLPVHVVWPTSAIVTPRLRVAIDAIVDVTRPLLRQPMYR